MASLPPPKAVLFDIGGVCVISPMKGILEYEIANGIPPGYINHTISGTSPNGSWQRIERGEIPLDDTFFSAFGKELSSQDRWTAYWQKLLADPKKRQLLPRGWKEADGIPAMPRIDAKAMFWNMMRMARSPDPYMYPALVKLRESEKFVIAALSNTIDFPVGIRDEKGDEFLSGLQKELPNMRPKNLPPASTTAESGERQDLRDVFEVFVSSAHVGMRKPERRIYELAVQEVQLLGRKRGIDIAPNEILFLDDIGGNLKMGREVGMRTLKVLLGKTRDAVLELEKQVGVPLLEPQAKL